MKKSKISNTHTIEDPKLYPYVIQMDQYGYALNKYVEAENNTRIKTIAYLSSLEQCLDRLAKELHGEGQNQLSHARAAHRAHAADGAGARQRRRLAHRRDGARRRHCARGGVLFAAVHAGARGRVLHGGVQQVGHDCHLQPGAELVHEPDGGRADPLCGHAGVGRQPGAQH